MLDVPEESAKGAAALPACRAACKKAAFISSGDVSQPVELDVADPAEDTFVFLSGLCRESVGGPCGVPKEVPAVLRVSLIDSMKMNWFLMTHPHDGSRSTTCSGN